jgi:hypothetical protein
MAHPGRNEESMGTMTIGITNIHFLYRFLLTGFLGRYFKMGTSGRKLVLMG